MLIVATRDPGVSRLRGQGRLTPSIFIDDGLSSRPNR